MIESKIRKITIEFKDLDETDGLDFILGILQSMKHRGIVLKSFWANGGNIHD